MKYIDAGKLITEIERLRKEEYSDDTLAGDISCGALDYVLETIIPSLQQELPKVADDSKMENDTMYVEHGWVARDDDATIAFFFTKPNRACATRDRLYFEDELEEGMIPWVWANKKEQSVECIVLPSAMFPQLTWMDEPIEVELILRPYSK